MRRVLISLMLLMPVAAFGQAPPASLTFEVASVKPSPPLNLNPAAIAAGQLPHIGMNVRGNRLDIGYMSLADLIVMAFRIKPNQISGPEWMKTERFDILAIMPERATQDQVPEMMQALLAERFQLKVHRESHEDSAYALLVAKGGHKLKESPPDPEAPAGDSPSDGIKLPNGLGQVKIDRGGGGATVVSPQRGTTRMSMTPDGQMRMEASKVTMEAFAQMLTQFVDRPVIDMTELKGNFQVALDISRDSLIGRAKAAGLNIPLPAGRGGQGAPGAPAGSVEASDPSSSSIFTSVQQLGLRLEPRKMQLEHIVVDHLEKTPTEN
jgi:uncharacterized protein (TIGR03435 family)